MFNGYNQPTLESDPSRGGTIKKPGHVAGWPYGDQYYNPEAQQQITGTSWQPKPSYLSAPPKCNCVECQQGSWFHKEQENACPSSSQDMMLMGQGGAACSYPVENPFIRPPESYPRPNPQLAKSFPPCSYGPSPHIPSYTPKPPAVKHPTNSEYPNSEQYYRMFDQPTYNRKPPEPRQKYWDGTNGAFYPAEISRMQQLQYQQSCRFPTCNPPYFYQSSSTVQPYQQTHQNGASPYLNAIPNAMRPPDQHPPPNPPYLKRDSGPSKISPLRLMRKKKLIGNLGQASPPRTTQPTDCPPTLDVRRFLATWAEDEESQPVPQLVVLDCQEINPDQAEILKWYEESTSRNPGDHHQQQQQQQQLQQPQPQQPPAPTLVPPHLIKQPQLELRTEVPQRSDPSKITVDLNPPEQLEVQVAPAPVPLTSTNDFEFEKTIQSLRETHTELKSPGRISSSTSPANSNESLPVLADLPTSEYRKNKFLDYDQPTISHQTPIVANPNAVQEMEKEKSIVSPVPVNSNIESDEKLPDEKTKKGGKKRNRKPTIKFSIQKSHDLKISLRVLNENKKQEQCIESFEDTAQVNGNDQELITLSLKGVQEDDLSTEKLSQSGKRTRKLKRKRYLEQTYSVSSEEHFSDTTADGFQVQESADSAKIKLTFKRRKAETVVRSLDGDESLDENQLKGLKTNADSGSEAICEGRLSPNEATAADTTTDCNGLPAVYKGESKEPENELETSKELETNVAFDPLYLGDSSSNQRHNVADSDAEFKIERDQPVLGTVSPTIEHINNEASPAETTKSPRNVEKGDEKQSEEADSTHQDLIARSAVAPSSSSPNITSSGNINTPRTSTDSIERELQAIWNGELEDKIHGRQKSSTVELQSTVVPVVDFYTEDIPTDPIYDDVGRASFGSQFDMQAQKQEVETIPTSLSNIPVVHSNEPVKPTCEEKESTNFTSRCGVIAFGHREKNTEDDGEKPLDLRSSLLSESSSRSIISSEVNECENREKTDVKPKEKDSLNILHDTDRVPATCNEKDISKGEEEDDDSRFLSNYPFGNQSYLSRNKGMKKIESSATSSCQLKPLLNDTNSINVQPAKLTHCVDSLSMKQEILPQTKIPTQPRNRSFDIANIMSDIHSDSTLFGNKKTVFEEDTLTTPVDSPTKPPAEGTRSEELLGEMNLSDEDSSDVINEVYYKLPAKNKPQNFEEVELIEVGAEIKNKPDKSSEISLNVDNSKDETRLENSCVENVSNRDISETDDKLKLDDANSVEVIDYDSSPALSSCVLKTSIDGTLHENQGADQGTAQYSPTSVDSAASDKPENKLSDEPPDNNVEPFEEHSRKMNENFNDCTKVPCDDQQMPLDEEMREIESNSECGKEESRPSIEKDNQQTTTNLPILSGTVDDSSLVFNSKINQIDEPHEPLPVNTSEIDENMLVLPEKVSESEPMDIDLAPSSDLLNFVVDQKKNLSDCSTNLKDEMLNNEENMKDLSEKLIGTKLMKIDLAPSPDSPKSVNEKHENLDDCRANSMDGMLIDQRNVLEKVMESESMEIDIAASPPSLTSIDDSSKKDEHEEQQSVKTESNPNSDGTYLHSHDIATSDDSDFDIATSPRDKESTSETPQEYDSIEDIESSNKTIADNAAKELQPPELETPLLNDTSITVNREEISEEKDNIELEEDNAMILVEGEEESDENANFIVNIESEENEPLLMSDENSLDQRESFEANDEVHISDEETVVEANNSAEISIDESRLLTDEVIKDGEVMSINESVIVEDWEGIEDLEEGEYVVVGESGELSNMDMDTCFSMNNQEDQGIADAVDEETINVADIPLPPGVAPVANCFDISKWVEKRSFVNILSQQLQEKLRQSPFTTESLDLFRNPSPPPCGRPGTPRLVLSPPHFTSLDSVGMDDRTIDPCAEGLVGKSVHSSSNDVDDDDQLPDDAEFRDVMENCLENAKKFLSGEKKESTSDSGESKESSLVTLSDVDQSSTETSSQDSPLYSALGPEILPVDNWPYLEEEVPLSPSQEVCEDQVPLIVEMKNDDQSNLDIDGRPLLPPFLCTERSRAQLRDIIKKKKLSPPASRKHRKSSLNNIPKLDEDLKCRVSLERLKVIDNVEKPQNPVKEEQKKDTVCELIDEFPFSKVVPLYQSLKWQPRVLLRRLKKDNPVDKKTAAAMPERKTITSPSLFNDTSLNSEGDHGSNGKSASKLKTSAIEERSFPVSSRLIQPNERKERFKSGLFCSIVNEGCDNRQSADNPRKKKVPSSPINIFSEVDDLHVTTKNKESHLKTCNVKNTHDDSKNNNSKNSAKDKYKKTENFDHNLKENFASSSTDSLQIKLPDPYENSKINKIELRNNIKRNCEISHSSFHRNSTEKEDGVVSDISDGKKIESSTLTSIVNDTGIILSDVKHNETIIEEKCASKKHRFEMKNKTPKNEKNGISHSKYSPNQTTDLIAKADALHDSKIETRQKTHGRDKRRSSWSDYNANEVGCSENQLINPKRDNEPEEDSGRRLSEHKFPFNSKKDDISDTDGFNSRPRENRRYSSDCNNLKSGQECGSGISKKRKVSTEFSRRRDPITEDEFSATDVVDPWVCVCGFADLSEREEHVQQHSFHCQSCHLAFKSEQHFISHLSLKHNDITKKHHCLLCELSFDLEKDYHSHLKTREHTHLESVERSTIHTLFTLLTGETCPVLGSVQTRPEWLPSEPGTVHFYHQATPLSLAVQYWKMKNGETPAKH